MHKSYRVIMLNASTTSRDLTQTPNVGMNNCSALTDRQYGAQDNNEDGHHNFKQFPTAFRTLYNCHNTLKRLGPVLK